MNIVLFVFYRCLSELFRRSLKDGARIMDKSSCLISPVDGKVLHHGTVDCGALEQIKVRCNTIFN